MATLKNHFANFVICRGQIDYNKEIPFEKRPAAGFYDTGDEKYVPERMEFNRLRQHDLDEKRRDEAENKERKKDKQKLKDKKENNIPAAFNNEADDQVRRVQQG